MHVVPISDAPGYEAPGHIDVAMRRLQGREAGPSDSVWMGLSVIAPGGRIEPSATAVEKFYLVIEGHLQVTAVLDDVTQVAVLGPMDSCRIAGGESRELRNTTTEPVRVILVMPNT